MLIIPQSDSQSASVVFQQVCIFGMPPNISVYRNLKQCVILFIIFQFNDTACWGLYLIFSCTVQVLILTLLFSGDLCYYISFKNVLDTDENKYPETFREAESTNTCHVTLGLETTGVFKGRLLTCGPKYRWMLYKNNTTH